MCVVSMVGDHYSDKWRLTYPHVQQWWTVPVVVNGPTRQEFDALKAEVEEMKALLLRAKEYDRKNGEPDCEMDEKVALLRKVAELVGVDLSEVFGKAQDGA